MKRVSVSFDLVEDDIVALACHYYESSSTVLANRRMGQWGLALLVAVGGALLLEQRKESPALGVGCLVGAILVAAFFPFWHRSALRRSAHRFATEPAYEKILGPFTVTLSNDGVTSASRLGESKLNWDAIDRYAVTPDHLFIFLAGPQGYAIPRAQVSDTVIEEMTEILESHVRK